MKIKKQTESFLSIKEGNASTMFLGLLFLIVGLWVGYILLNSPNNEILSWVISVVFIAVGALMFFFSYAITVDFDKGTQQVLYKERGLIRNKKMSFNISDVIRVEKRNGWKMDTSKSGHMSISKQIPTSQLFLIFKDGLALPISVEKSPSSGILVSGLNTNVFNKNINKNIGNAIATFLGIPFQDIDLHTEGIETNPSVLN